MHNLYKKIDHLDFYFQSRMPERPQGLRICIALEETGKLGEMKAEYTKLVLLLRRSMKNYDELKPVLKVVEKYNVQTRIKND